MGGRNRISPRPPAKREEWTCAYVDLTHHTQRMASNHSGSGESVDTESLQSAPPPSKRFRVRLKVTQ